VAGCCKHGPTGPTCLKNVEVVPAATATLIQLQHFNIWIFPIPNYD